MAKKLVRDVLEAAEVYRAARDLLHEAGPEADAARYRLVRAFKRLGDYEQAKAARKRARAYRKEYRPVLDRVWTIR